MSYDLQRKIWERGPRDSASRLLLLAILFHRNRETGLSRPSVGLLGERSGITERHARRLLRALARDGWIVVIPGGGRHRPNHYRLCEERFSTGVGNPDMDVPLSSEKPGHLEHETRTSETQNPDTHVRRTGGDSERDRGADASDVPLPVIHEAPSPCPRHPNGWHHDDPCRRCRDLRIYDAQQRSARSPINSQPVHSAPPREHVDPELAASGMAQVRAELAAARGDGVDSVDAHEKKNGRKFDSSRLAYAEPFKSRRKTG